MAKVRIRYPQTFKDEAVRRILFDGAPLTLTAVSLGVPKSVLSKWVKKQKESTLPAASGPVESAPRGIQDLETRILRLERSLETFRKILENALVQKTSLLLRK